MQNIIYKKLSLRINTQHMLTQQNSVRQLSHFPIVGIGASAGGLKPLKEIIAEIPAGSGLAYVIVQHLAADHQSKLPELLAPHSKIPVHEIVNKIHLEPDNIYIIPENNNVIVVDGILKLEQRHRGTTANRTIDLFFESLAEVHQSHAIGVLLSGASFDGTMGLKKIREYGGATIAQDPASAEFTAMPQSAIEADAIDYILYPRAIPDKLIEIHGKYEINYAYSEEEQIPEEDLVNKITNLIFLKTENDFRHYKQPTIRRRIARRMVVTKMENLAGYYNFMRTNAAEQQALFNDFLIPVTYFFRDEKPFQQLAEEVLPKMVRNASGNTLRIWVAGCSTGEEAYSVAMVVHEYLIANNHSDMRIQIFASDVSEKSIAKARNGIYNPQDVQQVSEARLGAYFSKRDGRFHVNKIIRDMCVFAVHNFIKDPPFARIDLVTCRNVMIYLDSYLQGKVLGAFHYSLKENAYLLLGKSESASAVPHLFETFGKAEKIYVRKFAANRYIPESFKPQHILPKDKPELKDLEKEVLPVVDFAKSFAEVLYNKYTPAGVVINRHYDIVHFHGATSIYLEPSPGKPNFNVLKMAREGLSFELRNALSIIGKSGESIVKQNIRIHGQPYLASFEIAPLKHAEGYFMIVFNQMPIAVVAGNGLNDDQGRRISELENMLEQMSGDIKRVTEEQQTAYEELQTTNEELLSSTEELQALNEELETSTEELQSNNEELLCVNDELQDRQVQLLAMRNYAESIIRTLREPILILNKDFMVQGCNPAYYKYFSGNEQETENRSIFEIGNHLWDIPVLKENLKKLTRENIDIENLKLELVIPFGNKKTVMANVTRIQDAKPEGLMLLALEDVTNEIESTRQIESKNAQLEQYNKHLQLFTVSTKQNFEDPLNKLKMIISRLSEDKDEDEKNRYLARMYSTVDDMQKMLVSIANYSEATLREEHSKKTNLNAMLKKILGELKDKVIQNNAVVSVVAIPEAYVIPNQIKQLFQNLILNAIENSRDGIAPEIEISGKIEEPEDMEIDGADRSTKYLMIKVEDNGNGIQESVLDKISEPFYSGPQRYFAMGLRLALVKKVVDNHNGFLSIENKPDHGSALRMWIPVAP